MRSVAQFPPYFQSLLAGLRKALSFLGVISDSADWLTAFWDLVGQHRHLVQCRSLYRYAKPDKGELWERFKIVPPISVALSDDVVLFSDQSTKEVVVSVQSFAPNQKGELSLHLPNEWGVEPLTQSFDLPQEGKQVSLKFTVSPPKQATETMGATL